MAGGAEKISKRAVVRKGVYLFVAAVWAIYPRTDPSLRPRARILRAADVDRLGFFKAEFHSASVAKLFRIASAGSDYRFFHPPRWPGAPPVERGEGPNSGPDWRESVGWKILLPLRAGELGSDGVRVWRPGR